MSREAMTKALDALENLNGIDTETECVTIAVDEEIAALRAALSEPVAAPPADLLAALKELVRLKDIKERIERGSELNGEWTDYEVNKEWAWQAARAAIARHS